MNYTTTPRTGYVRAYLRASTSDQDATRAKESLERFAAEHGREVVSWYIETASGTKLEREELKRLLADSKPGDILLLEQVDRLTRLAKNDWEELKRVLQEAGVLVVAMDLPTSHAAMKNTERDSFTSRMLEAINSMLLDMLAAVAHKDWEDRKRRQRAGIEKAKARDAFKGRPIDKEKEQRVAECLGRGLSLRKTAEAAGCSLSTVQRVKARLEEAKAATA